MTDTDRDWCACCGLHVSDGHMPSCETDRIARALEELELELPDMSASTYARLHAILSGDGDERTA